MQGAGFKHVTCCSGSPLSTLRSVDWLACARLNKSPEYRATPSAGLAKARPNAAASHHNKQMR